AHATSLCFFQVPCRHFNSCPHFGLILLLNPAPIPAPSLSHLALPHADSSTPKQSGHRGRRISNQS
ncbi:unnamed protein product, partial [Prunus brigantina]